MHKFEHQKFENFHFNLCQRVPKPQNKLLVDIKYQLIQFSKCLNLPLISSLFKTVNFEIFDFFVFDFNFIFIR